MKVVISRARLPLAALLLPLAAACSQDNSVGGGATGSASGTAETTGSGGTGTTGTTGGSSGSATTGLSGTATTGASGTATTGTSGTATGATAGTSGTAATGASGTAATGASGTATTGASGTATTGASGTATTGASGTATMSDAGMGASGSVTTMPGSATCPATGCTPGAASMCTTAMAPPISATICDGFEGAAPGAAGSDFTVSVAAGDTMVVDTTKSFRGSKSMHFTASTMAYIVNKTMFTGTTKATNNVFWGRYFFFNNSATDTLVSHHVFGTMQGTDTVNANADAFHFVGGSRGTLQTQIQTTQDLYTGGGTTPAATDPKDPTPADGWECWEWQIQADDSFQFYINGTAVPEMALTAGKSTAGTVFPLPTIMSLELGYQYFGTVANSGWVDEVALGPNRIGCGN
jgi:hypothetical protein